MGGNVDLVCQTTSLPCAETDMLFSRRIVPVRWCSEAIDDEYDTKLASAAPRLMRADCSARSQVSKLVASPMASNRDSEAFRFLAVVRCSS